MDPYFRPILLSTLIVILLNTVLIVPIAGAPFLSYFAGGVIAVLLFAKEMRTKIENYEVKVFDVSVLGLSVGVLVGAILTLVMTFKLKDPETKQYLIDAMNEAMRMRSAAGFEMLDDLGPMFYVVLALITMLVSSFVCFFGSLTSLAFVNKANK